MASPLPPVAVPEMLDDRLAMAIRLINHELDCAQMRRVNDLEVKVLRDPHAYASMLTWWESSLGIRLGEVWNLMAEWHAWNHAK